MASLYPPLQTLATTSYLLSLFYTTHTLITSPTLLSIHNRYPSPLSPFAPLIGFYFIPHQLLQGLWLYRVWKTGGSTSWLRSIGPRVEELDEDEDSDDEEYEGGVSESNYYTSASPPVPSVVVPARPPRIVPASHPYATKEASRLHKRTALSTAFYLPLSMLSSLLLLLTLLSIRRYALPPALTSSLLLLGTNLLFIVLRLGNLPLPSLNAKWTESTHLELLLHIITKLHLGLSILLTLPILGALLPHPSNSIPPLAIRLLLAALLATIASLGDLLLGGIAIFTSLALALGQHDRWRLQLSVLTLILATIVGVRAIIVAMTTLEKEEMREGLNLPPPMGGVRGYGALDVDTVMGGMGSNVGAGTPGGAVQGTRYDREVVDVNDSEDVMGGTGPGVKVGFVESGPGMGVKEVGMMPDGPVGVEKEEKGK